MRSYPDVRIKNGKSAHCNSCGRRLAWLTRLPDQVEVITWKDGVAAKRIVPKFDRGDRLRLVFAPGWVANEQERLYRLGVSSRVRLEATRERASWGDSQAQQRLRSDRATRFRRDVPKKNSDGYIQWHPALTLDDLSGSWRARCPDCGTCNVLTVSGHKA